jgi:hypothetical protein
MPTTLAKEKLIDHFSNNLSEEGPRKEITTAAEWLKGG